MINNRTFKKHEIGCFPELLISSTANIARYKYSAESERAV